MISRPSRQKMWAVYVSLWTVGCIALRLAELGAQRTPAEAEVFEVASIKPNSNLSRSTSFNYLPGSLVITNAPLSLLITEAYQVPPGLDRYLLVVGPQVPRQLLSTRFDISARSATPLPALRVRSMLRPLLDERFKLRTHVESRPIRVYAMRTRRKNQLGPELRPSSHNCEDEAAAVVASGKPPREVPPPVDRKGRPICWGKETSPPGFTTLSSAGKLSGLIFYFQGRLDRPVLDETGLTGNFEYYVRFTTPDRTQELPAIFTALREQLGLTLEPRVAPMDVTVIDALEFPTAD